MLRNPQLLVLLALLPAIAIVWYWRRGRLSGAVLALRLLAVALVVVALADPVLSTPTTASGTLVLLVDQSDSLGDMGKAALRDQAAALAREHAGRVHTFYFGANTVAVPDLADRSSPAGPSLKTDDTDIAGALQQARSLLAASGGRIVLLSDGAQTRGDALAAAQTLRAAGVSVDTLAYQTPAQPEIWLAAIDLPSTLRAGEEYTIQIVVASTGAAAAQLTLYEGPRQLAAQAVSLTPGENRFSYTSRARTYPAVHRSQRAAR